MMVIVDGDVIVDKDERPPIPVLAVYAEVADAVANLVHSCWAREPDRRPSFASVSASLEEVWRLHGHGSPQLCRASTPMISIGSAPVMSTESSPADEQYETAPESLTTDVEEENMDSMTDVPLTSPGPAHLARSVVQVNANYYTEGVSVSTQVSSGVLESQDKDTPTPSPTKDLEVDTRNEENYRLLVGSNHAFHHSREFLSLKVYRMLNQNVLVFSDASSMVPDARRTWCGWIPFQAQGRVYHVVQCDRPSPELRGATPSLAVHVWVWQV